MKKLAGCICALIIIMTSAANAHAEDTNARIYNHAGELYAAGDYDGALALYNSIGVTNPDLEYNRGSAYLKLGKIGKAALNFRRALRLRPGDEDTIGALEYIRSIKVDREPAPKQGAISGVLLAIVNALSLTALTWGAVALYFAISAVALGLILSFDPVVKRILLKSLGALALVSACWVSITGVRIYKFGVNNRAVVIVSAGEVYSAPSEKAEKAFTFHEGTEVALGRVKGNYVFVTLRSGYSGWAARGAVERI